MTEMNARALAPVWSATDAESAAPKMQRKEKKSMNRYLEDFIRRHMITLLLAVLMLLEGLLVGWGTAHKVRKETEARLAEEYAAQLEQYKADQAYQAQAAHWLSGDASREAFINQEILAGAKLIAKEANDQVKGTKLGVAIARMMNPNYPGTIQEVAAQENQFMFYSADNTYTQHDWDLAESMIRPFYEDGVLPNGLTQDMVYFEWNGNSGTARDSYETTTGMSTWRYQG